MRCVAVQTTTRKEERGERTAMMRRRRRRRRREQTKRQQYEAMRPTQGQQRATSEEANEDETTQSRAHG